MLRYISGTAGPGHLIQLKKLTPAVIDGQVIPTSQTLLLDTDAQCVLSGVERSKSNFSNKDVAKIVFVIKEWKSYFSFLVWLLNCELNERLNG